MRSPSKNISKSLRSQRPTPGAPYADVGRVKQGMSGGVYPGERGVEDPPGQEKEGTVKNQAHVLDRMVR